MDERYSKLEITPKLIDFGSRVVQMKLVTSVGLGSVYPLRTLSKAIMLLTLLLVIAAMGQSQNVGPYQTAPTANAKMLLWLASVVGALAAVATWFKEESLLVIMLAGSEKIVLAGIQGRFLEKLLDRVREAMVAPENAPIHYTVNIKAETIETGALVDLSRTSIEHSPGAAVVAGDAQAAVTTNGSAHANGRAVGTSPATRAEPRHHATPPPLAATPAKMGPHSVRSAVVSNSPAGIAIGGNVAASTVISRASVGEDISALIALVEASSIADRQQVLEYLRYLRQLDAAGPARADDARASWARFFEYAVTALTGIDGFITIAERVHRWYSRAS